MCLLAPAMPETVGGGGGKDAMTSPRHIAVPAATSRQNCRAEWRNSGSGGVDGNHGSSSYRRGSGSGDYDSSSGSSGSSNRGSGSGSCSSGSATGGIRENGGVAAFHRRQNRRSRGNVSPR